MRHEYSQSRFDSPSKSRSNESERERFESSAFERDDYGNTNAPMEWDNRRYGQGFNDDSNEGGRGRNGRGPQGNRVQGGNQGWYGGQEVQGPYGRREQTRYAEVGRSNLGSSKYGGSDYLDNDYLRNESRYGSPYSEQSTRQQLGEDLSDHSRYDSSDSDVIGNNRSRMSGGGEWYGDIDRAGTLRQTYGRNMPRAYEQYGYRGHQNRSQQSGSEYGGDQSQSFRGRGPKGYERSDDRLKEIICEALTDAPHIDASDISVEVKKGEVTLTGCVVDRRAKYAAEDLIEHRAGVNEIHNQLKVRGQSGSQQASEDVAGRSAQSGAKAGQDTIGSGNKNTGDKLSGKNAEH
jgi:osmotically-inducible protein OsmY